MKRTNRMRASHARAALQEHALAKGDSVTLTPDNIVDLLADLRHLCDERGEDFSKLDRCAYQHYLNERKR